MFFLLLLIILFAAVGSGQLELPKQIGWLMFIGFGWFAGFLDCRRFSKSDQDAQRVMPPDIQDPSDDQHTFQS